MCTSNKDKGVFVWFEFFSLSFLGASGVTHKSQGSLWDIWCFLQVSITGSLAKFNKVIFKLN